MQFHSLANMLPLLEGNEFSALVEDIRTRGLIEPIALYQGMILDGRNRYRACEVAAVDPRYELYTGDDPAAFVISLNLKRRHLNESQRAMVAAKLANMTEGRPSKKEPVQDESEIQRRLDRSTYTSSAASSHMAQPLKTAQICAVSHTSVADIQSPIKTAPIGAVSQDTAADLLHVSRRSVQHAEAIHASGDTALITAVEQGRLAVSAAAKLIKEPEAVRKAVVEQVSAGKAAPAALKEVKREERTTQIKAAAATVPAATERYELHHATCIDALSIGNESVDIIVTDPPYPREFLSVYGDLARVGAHVLKPGGVALIMVGQSYLPDIIAALDEHLTYHWTLAYLTPGGQAVQQFPCKVNTFWKPVLVYRKGDYSGDWFGDVSKSDVNDNDKEHHHWGQSASGMRDLMRRFVRPGQRVLDPFLGGGTTAVVALELGAYFIGFDIESDAIETTRARIGEINAAKVA